MDIPQRGIETITTASAELAGVDRSIGAWLGRGGKGREFCWSRKPSAKGPVYPGGPPSGRLGRGVASVDGCGLGAPPFYLLPEGGHHLANAFARSGAHDKKFDAARAVAGDHVFA